VASLVISGCRPQLDAVEDFDFATNQAIQQSLDPRFNVDPASSRAQPAARAPPKRDAAPIPPDELAAMIGAAIRRPSVLRPILARLPGVDPDDRRFASFYTESNA
jgi:hypothetical protein